MFLFKKYHYSLCVTLFDYVCLTAQIADLESEDGKNDTMVDVVFKKALKEFRINIFNSYSTALAVSHHGFLSETSADLCCAVMAL